MSLPAVVSITLEQESIGDPKWPENKSGDETYRALHLHVQNLRKDQSEQCALQSRNLVLENDPYTLDSNRFNV